MASDRFSHLRSIGRMRPIFHILFLVLLLPRDAAGQELPIQSYTIREGLPSNTIKALIQDSQGYIWVGTTNGLARYDGYEFAVFTTADGLSDSYITDLAESPAEPGVIWIGTVAGGLCAYKDGRCAVIDGGETVEERYISDVHADRKGNVWYGGQRGLKVIDHGAIRWIRKLDALPPSNIMLSESKDGVVYAAIRDTLYRISGETLVPLPAPGGRTEPILTISPDSSDNIWAMRQDSLLVRYTHSTITYQRKLSFHPGISMADDGRGNLWLSLYRNLIKFSIAYPEKITSYDRRDGLPEAILGPLLVDREKNLWIGSLADGLKKLSHFNYRTLSTSAPGRYSRNIWGIFDRQERCWIGTAGQLLEVYPGGEKREVTAHRIGSAGPSVEILPLGMSESGTLYLTLADRKTLYRFQVSHDGGGPSSMRELAAIPVFPRLSGTILNGCITRGGDIVLGIADTGIAVFGANDFLPKQLITPADGLLGRSIIIVYEDAGGDVWAGDFTEGLTRLHKENGRWKVAGAYTVRDGLPDNHIRSIAQDGQGRLWIGTRYGGVTCYDGHQYRTIARKDGLHGDKIWDIAPAGNTVWVGTDYGLERIDAATFTVVQAPSILAGSNVLRCGITGEGKVWFLTPYSLNVYDFTSEETNLMPPPVRITAMTVNGKDRDLAALSDLQSDEDDCIIDFVGLSYRDDGVKRYQYRLEGMDRDWHTTSQRAVTMAGLSPNTYTFAVRALNSDGVASAVPAMLRFRILPPFWQRWWFVATGALCVAGIVAYGVKRRVRALERDRLVQYEFSRRLIESQENERKRIASELHDSIGQNLLIIKNRAMFGLQGADAGSPVAEHLREITALSGDTIDQAREISYNLRPYQIDRIGLTKALQSIVTRMSRATTMTIAGDIEPIDDLFPKEQEIIIYRILQEAMNNVVKHSGAATASVTIRNDVSTISIVIADTGKGFPVPPIHHGQVEGSGLGLRSIGERVRILGGSLTINSSPGQGTTLSILLPVQGAHT
jgi:signal transduction histidine kinase/ligand-binding sensor domain-containing protein